MFSMARAAWCAAAERELQSAARGDMAGIRADVLDGAAVLWRVTGESVGWVVTREEGSELVIVAGAGKNCLPVLIRIRDRAADAGMTIRTHITSAALQRIYARLGFVERERVMSYGRKQ